MRSADTAGFSWYDRNASPRAPASSNSAPTNRVLGIAIPMHDEIDYFDLPMSCLTNEDYEALFAVMTEEIATSCREKYPALRDEPVNAMHLVIDELAYAWAPELTARECVAAVCARLGLDPGARGRSPG